MMGRTVFQTVPRIGNPSYTSRQFTVNGTLAGDSAVKRFDYREEAIYPDLGTRYQTFSNEDMLEMETVGELVTLPPGQSAELVESWELFGNVPDVRTEADADKVVRPLVGG